YHASASTASAAARTAPRLVMKARRSILRTSGWRDGRPDEERQQEQRRTVANESDRHRPAVSASDRRLVRQRPIARGSRRPRAWAAQGRGCPRATPNGRAAQFWSSVEILLKAGDEVGELRKKDPARVGRI